MQSSHTDHLLFQPRSPPCRALSSENSAATCMRTGCQHHCHIRHAMSVLAAHGPTCLQLYNLLIAQLGDFSSIEGAHRRKLLASLNLVQRLKGLQEHPIHNLNKRLPMSNGQFLRGGRRRSCHMGSPYLALFLTQNVPDFDVCGRLQLLVTSRCTAATRESTLLVVGIVLPKQVKSRSRNRCQYRDLTLISLLLVLKALSLPYLSP